MSSASSTRLSASVSTVTVYVYASTAASTTLSAHYLTLSSTAAEILLVLKCLLLNLIYKALFILDMQCKVHFKTENKIKYSNKSSNLNCCGSDS